jgi:predicted AAA+ superfamily ATPase
MMKFLSRSKYINKLASLKDTDLIKIITGIRKCGKSIILKEYINNLFDVFNVNIKNVLFYDFNIDSIKTKFSDYKILLNDIEEKSNVEGKIYIFIDEVQIIDD